MDEPEDTVVVELEDREPKFVHEVKRVQEEPKSIVVGNQPVSLDSN